MDLSSEVVAELRDKAGKGDLQSLGRLGRLYQKGIGVTQDSSEAVRLFQTGADAGDKVCQARLGNAFRNGNGTTKNMAKAARLFTAAAEQDSPAGIFNLGICYLYGEGARKSYKKAKACFERVVELGFPSGGKGLRLMVKDGLGMPTTNQLLKKYSEPPYFNAEDNALERHTTSWAPESSRWTRKSQPALTEKPYLGFWEHYRGYALPTSNYLEYSLMYCCPNCWSEHVEIVEDYGEFCDGNPSFHHELSGWGCIECGQRKQANNLNAGPEFVLSKREILCRPQLPRQFGGSGSMRLAVGIIRHEGPYLSLGGNYWKLENDDPYTITKERAFEVAEELQSMPSKRIGEVGLPRYLGRAPDGGPISVEGNSSKEAQLQFFLRSCGYHFKSRATLEADDPYTITLERALELIEEIRRAPAKKLLSGPILSFKDQSIVVIRNPYRLFVRSVNSKRYAKFPMDQDPSKITLEQCEALLATALDPGKDGKS